MIINKTYIFILLFFIVSYIILQYRKKKENKDRVSGATMMTTDKQTDISSLINDINVSQTNNSIDLSDLLSNPNVSALTYSSTETMTPLESSSMITPTTPMTTVVTLLTTHATLASLVNKKIPFSITSFLINTKSYIPDVPTSVSYQPATKQVSIDLTLPRTVSLHPSFSTVTLMITSNRQSYKVDCTVHRSRSTTSVSLASLLVQSVTPLLPSHSTIQSVSYRLASSSNVLSYFADSSKGKNSYDYSKNVVLQSSDFPLKVLSITYNVSKVNLDPIYVSSIQRVYSEINSLSQQVKSLNPSDIEGYKQKVDMLEKQVFSWNTSDRFTAFDQPNIPDIHSDGMYLTYSLVEYLKNNYDYYDYRIGLKITEDIYTIPLRIDLSSCTITSAYLITTNEINNLTYIPSRVLEGKLVYEGDENKDAMDSYKKYIIIDVPASNEIRDIWIHRQPSTSFSVQLDPSKRPVQVSHYSLTRTGRLLLFVDLPLEYRWNGMIVCTTSLRYIEQSVMFDIIAKREQKKVEDRLLEQTSVLIPLSDAPMGLTRQTVSTEPMLFPFQYDPIGQYLYIDVRNSVVTTDYFDRSNVYVKGLGWYDDSELVDGKLRISYVTSDMVSYFLFISKQNNPPCVEIVFSQPTQFALLPLKDAVAALRLSRS